MPINVTYTAPYTSAPTKQQQHNSPRNLVIATVSAFGFHATLLFVTHDFGLSAAELALGYPLVTLTGVLNSSFFNNWAEISQSPDYTVFKLPSSGGGNAKVAIARPATQAR